jgi:hypothetical protein
MRSLEVGQLSTTRLSFKRCCHPASAAEAVAAVNWSHNQPATLDESQGFLLHGMFVDQTDQFMDLQRKN